MTLSAYALGATLYMPATRTDLLEVARGHKIPELRSLVICLEDAVSSDQLSLGLANLRQLLQHLPEARTAGPLLFIRPRTPEMLEQILAWPEITALTGLVLPKLRLSNLSLWHNLVQGSPLLLMPTLETPEVYDPGAMLALRDALLETLGARIIAVRIGGNDLLGCLGLRRPRDLTLYDTPLGYVIGMLSGILGSAGLRLTAPVFEQINAPQLLKRELQLDIAHGLVGKTAIHPSQIALIHQALKVPAEDLASAQRILKDNAPAVFQYQGVMCEAATHVTWAKRVLERAHWHGIVAPTALMPLSATLEVSE